ncbi:IS110 family transposase [Rickettsia helvetica]|uniref:IS110 family transposase n=2 Tax=Rickettsia helvetica TaxID=35789 RepID=A0ABM9NDN9_RICHE|nr:IS110 family transposase [Rickettsia helvetica]MCZ6884007.1 IS110 family transposase [Rickettsia endosymbiont of Ixodes ricinus]MCZ6896636.1 IS110 family transposase [Rickettsia endosymbiont of Ixodes ricinus]
MDINTIGIDIAKRTFQIHGVDRNGKTVLKKKVSRDQVLSFMVKLPKCLIGIEACGGANYWARELIKLGHEVRLIAPQFVKPYVKTNKNDQADAEAICEAVTRPNMRFVPIKSIEQQDILSIHRVRERLVRNRTALANEIRGLLLEFGFIIPQGINKVIVKLTEILDEGKLSELSYQTFNKLKEEFVENDKKVKELEKRLKVIAMDSRQCQQLITIPGIGLITATALVASIGNAANFENGRQLSAWLGLVPRQHSSGGKERLLGISKRGDIYLRTLLIQGGRAVLNAKLRFISEEQKSKKDYSKFTGWIFNLIERRGHNKTVVAVANKLARVVFAVLSSSNNYLESKVCS